MNLKSGRSEVKVPIISLLVIGLVMGCAVEFGQVRVKDGKRYGELVGVWRARWWNYYERGLSYAEGGFWQEAIDDFQAAVKQRRGRNDRRRARTYGLHIIEYFPHRELGVAYHHLQRYGEAQRAFETSLSTVDSAKATFYLNKVRQVRLEQSGDDTGPPRITLADPLISDRVITNQDTLTVRGQVEDDTYVSAISVNRARVFFDRTEPLVTFEQDVTLQDGRNTLEVVAVDLLGNLTRKQVTIDLDRKGPLISLVQAEATGTPPRQRVRIEASVFDHSRITRFQLAGREIIVPPQTPWLFREEIPLPDRAAAVPFEAIDAAGNIIRGEFILSPRTRVRKAQREPPPMHAALQRWAALPGAAVMSDATPTPPPRPQIAQSLDRSLDGPSIELGGFLSEEALADAKGPITLTDKTVYLEGKISSNHTITSFSIDGKGCWERKSQQIFFGHKVVLKPGDNRFVLEAVDEKGRAHKHEIIVARALQKIKQLDARLRVALLPFEIKGKPSDLAQAVDDNFIQALVRQERFALVSRTQLEKAVSEMKFSREAIVNASAQAKLGKKTEAEGVLVGVVTESAPGFQVVSHYVDVRTSEVLASMDVYGEELTLPELQILLEGLAWKIKQHFPLSEGLVLKTEGKRVFVDLGTQHKLKKHMKLVLFRDGEVIKHPISGKVAAHGDRDFDGSLGRCGI